MKKTRSITIYIEKSGDPGESFDPQEYVKYFLDHQRSTFFGFNDDTMLLVRSSWECHLSPLRVLARYCRLILKIYARSGYQAIERTLWKALHAKKE
jgi:hypothetical protein